jgi:hypothetical protein
MAAGDMTSKLLAILLAEARMQQQHCLHAIASLHT